MNISDKGVEFIASFEKFDPVSRKLKSGLWVIGYNHVLGVKGGQTINVAQALLLFKEDLHSTVTKVNTIIDKYALSISQQQFDVLVDISYSLGHNMLDNIIKDTNNDIIIIANKILCIDGSDRRKAEYEKFIEIKKEDEEDSPLLRELKERFAPKEEEISKEIDSIEVEEPSEAKEELNIEEYLIKDEDEKPKKTIKKKTRARQVFVKLKGLFTR